MWGYGHYNKKGEYTVKSGYRMYAIQKQESTETMAENRKLDVPRKIQLFMWRIMHGIIPVRVALANRTLKNERFCPRCNQADETV